MTSPHEGLVITAFAEFRGVYEHYKAVAFAKHLRTLADVADRAAVVRPCPQAPERPWVSLQEWVENSGVRKGQWQSDIDVRVAGRYRLALDHRSDDRGAGQPPERPMEPDFVTHAGRSLTTRRWPPSMRTFKSKRLWLRTWLRSRFHV